MSVPLLTIFDCDGVLVDSEPVSNRVMAEMLCDLGFDISPESCMARFVGRSTESIQTEVEAEAGCIFPPDWPTDVRVRTVRALRTEKVAPIPGIRAVVETHRAAGRRYCVASSGRLEKMRATLGGAGLLPLFEDVLFSASMVRSGKPAPDLFLHAARTMAVPPEHCVVVEDSIPGIEAARAAGMRVCAYAAAPYSDPSRFRALGAEVFTGMPEMPRLLGLSGP